MSDGLTDTRPGYCRDTKHELVQCQQRLKHYKQEIEILRAEIRQLYVIREWVAKHPARNLPFDVNAAMLATQK